MGNKLKKYIIVLFGALVLTACAASEPVTYDNLLAAVATQEIAPKCVAQGLMSPAAAGAVMAEQRQLIIQRVSAAEAKQATDAVRQNIKDFDKNRAEHCAFLQIEGVRALRKQG